jgi:hypothetical protein
MNVPAGLIRDRHLATCFMVTSEFEKREEVSVLQEK